MLLDACCIFFLQIFFCIMKIKFSFFFSNMDGVGINLALGALKAIAFVCDILTFPIYAVIQKPWKRREQSRRVKVSIFKKYDFFTNFMLDSYRH